MGNVRRLLVIAGLVAAVAAVVLVVTPVSADSVDCGTVLASKAPGGQGLLEEAIFDLRCEEAVTDRRTAAIAAAVAALALLLAGALDWSRLGGRPEATDPHPLDEVEGPPW